MADTLQQQLQQGGKALALDLTSDQVAQLLDYVHLLAKWNKAYNLTSVCDPKEMISRHILDSLAILPYLSGETLLDVGTGAGLPGIPVAIARPNMTITLLDSNSKKTRFLQQAKAELQLDNIAIVHARIEQASLPKFAMVTTRAFATIIDIIALAGGHCDDAGCLLLMKGLYPQDELDHIDGKFKVKDVLALDVPGCSAERHLVRLVKDKG